MTDLETRLAKLSPLKRQLLLLQLKKETGLVPRKSMSAIESPIALDLKAEAVLDPSICPEALLPYKPVTEPLYILLTGGTGFLGAFLIEELLQRTQADIYCLVRAADAVQGKKRLQQNLEKYKVWNDDFSSRIIPVLGDLSKPKFGLDAHKFQALAGKIDTVYHSAALLNYVYPYSAMKQINVLGTQEILRFACQVKLKPVHYVSSVAVFESSVYAGKVLTEEDCIDETEGMFLGYSQTKWVSEKLVEIARDRGLPVVIYRPPFIAGHSQTGVTNTDDFICLMFKGCIQMGIVPDLDYLLDASPVDYVSQAIVYLSRQKQSLGKVFHLQQPQPMHLRWFVDWVRSFGYPIQLVSYEQWQEYLKGYIRSPEHPLYTLLPFLFEKWSSEQLTIPELYLQKRRPKISCHQTLDALFGSGIVCPQPNSEVLDIYLSYFIESGFLSVDDLRNISKKMTVLSEV
ncbi:MAG: NAD-dependent epimerase/dehydratase family protein [Symploca sp. SIO3C6]|nr:NAD-dependent epimerase/dehydratase family protein [Symploca sp. SIO3C6]NET06423.1 NAD-dependent epimerase/dehydratase family protein [Symploca sp. SIO2B6]